MNFLIDAQLPHRISRCFEEAGHNARHTLVLYHGNRTSDTEICDISIRERSVVITKDWEFVSQFLLTHKPYKLFLVSTGNIDNQSLEALLVPPYPEDRFCAGNARLHRTESIGVDHSHLIRRVK